MIRGQPKPPQIQQTPSAIASNPAVSSQPYQSRSPPTASPRQRPSSSRVNSPRVDYEYRYAEMRHNTIVPPTSGLVPRHSYGGYQPNFDTVNASPSDFYQQSMGSYSDPNVTVTTMDINSLYPPAFTPSTLTPPETVNFDPFAFTVPTFTFDSPPQEVASGSGQNAVQQEHVLYYFEHVRKMQFMFAGSNLVSNIIYSVSPKHLLVCSHTKILFSH